jgi:uncharacterized membrane protein
MIFWQMTPISEGEIYERQLMQKIKRWKFIASFLINILAVYTLQLEKIQIIAGSLEVRTASDVIITSCLSQMFHQYVNFTTSVSILTPKLSEIIVGKR